MEPMKLARGEGKAVNTDVFGVSPSLTSDRRDACKELRELRAAVSVARLETMGWVARSRMYDWRSSTRAWV